MDINTFKNEYLQQIQDVIREIMKLDLQPALEMIQSARRVWLAGNGGSATLAAHMATDLQLAGIRAQSLTDVAAITTYGNDNGFQYSLSKQIELLCEPEDLLILLSGSGNSENILQGFWSAPGCNVLAITGKGGGRFNECTQGFHFQHLHISTAFTPAGMGVAQDAHQILLHILCYHLINQLSAELRKGTK